MPNFKKEGEKMSNCKHVFVGKADGVHCAKCGLHMSAAEYVRFLHPETAPESPAEEPAPAQEAKPKRQTRKKVTKDG